MLASSAGWLSDKSCCTFPAWAFWLRRTAGVISLGTEIAQTGWMKWVMQQPRRGREECADLIWGCQMLIQPGVILTCKSYYWAMKTKWIGVIPDHVELLWVIAVCESKCRIVCSRYSSVKWTITKKLRMYVCMYVCVWLQRKTWKGIHQVINKGCLESRDEHEGVCPCGGEGQKDGHGGNRSLIPSTAYVMCFHLCKIMCLCVCVYHT